MDSDFPLRLAGTGLGLDIRDGLSNGSIGGLRQGFGTGRLMPQSLMGDFHAMAPEHSEPGYSLRGRYQPEVSYGA
jgi:hypothetical protein